MGSAAWYKNRKAVFKAFRHASEKSTKLDLKLILVGPKPQDGELDTRLSNWFQSHPNSVICLNKLSENSLSEIYKYAKALVFPSHIEGFGWPPLEAAVHGCLVITTRTGAISDLLGNYAHYIKADDQVSLDRAVFQVLESKNQMNDKILLPSYEKCRDQYYELYQKLLSS